MMAIDLVQPDAWQRSLPTTGTLAATFRRAGNYFRDQALKQSNTKLYLTPSHKHAQEEISQASSRDRTRPAYHPKVVPSADYLPPGISRPITTRSSTMSVNSASGPGIFQNMVRHQYASDNILQSYDVLETHRENGYWIVFIHGGYFRDPKVDSTSFKPTINLLEESDKHATTKKCIAGYASLNYRLSPHPAYTNDPDDTYTSHCARWPDQPNDVVAALGRLQLTYPGSKRYLLVGHSVGATLAWHAALRCADVGIAQPEAVVGVSGIYDFPAIHETNPDYQNMTANAIPRELWAEASPALHEAEEIAKKWSPRSGTRMVVIAHSADDGLVVLDQPREMMKVLGTDQFQTYYMDLRGAHNEIWEKTELARVIETTVAFLQ